MTASFTEVQSPLDCLSSDNYFLLVVVFFISVEIPAAVAKWLKNQ
jgi:hypothetical protein